MSYFSGEYECKLDTKGRLALPAKLKSALPMNSEGTLVAVRGFEPCLTLYPFPEWKYLFEKVSALNEFNAEYRQFQRNFLRGSMELEIDAAGRILLPKYLLKHAGIENDAVTVGVGNRIEVWQPETYEKYLITDPQEFAAMAEKYLGDVVPEKKEDKIMLMGLREKEA
jgi:MraZ protein